jgi:predicted lipoprotein
MIRPALIVLVSAALIAGCKIVAKSDDGDDVPQDDASRMAALVANDWEGRVLPRARETAAPLDEALAAISADFSAASERYGTRSGAEGAPANFIVRGEGTVVGANLESRAAQLNVDITGDGSADVEVQLGPVIRGTALRDSLPFYEFTAFRDQIEFAKLAGALNAAAHESLPDSPADAVGQTVAFTGVFTMTKSDDPKEIVPLDLTWGTP